MRIELIDGQPFLTIRGGKKSFTTTPAEATQAAHERIAAASAIIAQLRQAANAIQSQIESAVLAGEDARHHRSELDAIRHEINDHERDTLEALATIGEIAELVDHHHAALITRSDESRLAATLAQFNIDHLLKGTPTP